MSIPYHRQHLGIPVRRGGGGFLHWNSDGMVRGVTEFGIPNARGCSALKSLRGKMAKTQLEILDLITCGVKQKLPMEAGKRSIRQVLSDSR